MEAEILPSSSEEQIRDGKGSLLLNSAITMAWIDKQQAIADKCTVDCIRRYKSEHASPHSLPGIGLPKIVSDQENRELIRLLNLHEVQQALWSIDSGKMPGPDSLEQAFLRTIGILLKKTCSTLS